MEKIKQWVSDNRGKILGSVIVVVLLCWWLDHEGYFDQFLDQQAAPEVVFTPPPDDDKPAKPNTKGVKDACKAGAKEYFESDSAGKTLGDWLRKLAAAQPASGGKPAQAEKPAKAEKVSCDGKENDLTRGLQTDLDTCNEERNTCLEGENEALAAKDRDIANLRRDLEKSFKIISDFANNRVPAAKQQEIRSLYSCPEGTGMIRVETDDEFKFARIFFSNDPEKKWRKVDDFKMIMGFCWNIKDPFYIIAELVDGDFVEPPAEDDEEASPTLGIPLNVAVNLRSLSYDATNEDILADPITIGGVEYYAVKISFNK